MPQTAKMRLFHNADRSALVTEDSAEAAFLYAGVGDEIPDSACELYGLVDGALPDGGDDPDSNHTRQTKAQKAAADKQAKEAADKEAKEAADKEAKEAADKEAKEAADKAAANQAASA